MSDVRDPDRDQQLPVANTLPAVHDLCCDLMQERKAHGTRKYGTPLQPANGRSFLLDATEEAAYLLAYLRGRLWEEDNPEQTWVAPLLWACMTGGQYWGEFDQIPGIPPQVAELAFLMLAAHEADELEHASAALSKAQPSPFDGYDQPTLHEALGTEPT